MAHDVFISFSTEDKPIADAACAILEARRIRCWIAPRDVQPGIPYPQSIMEGIRGSRVLVLILSAKSNTSKHVMREVERAVNCEIAVIPFRIEDVSLSGSMEYLVGSLHWLDALTPPLERHLETLARRILALLAESAGGEASASPPRGKDVSTKGHVDSAPVAPRAGSPPGTSAPAQRPKATPQNADGLKPGARATPDAGIESEPLPQQTPVSRGRQVRHTSTQLKGAPPKRRNIRWLWFSVAALTLLAFLGVITYVVTIQRGPPEWTNSIGMRFVRIKPGEFLMGSSDRNNKATADYKPPHKVWISRAFVLGIHEVTQGQYQAVMGNNPSRLTGSDDLPVEQVSWFDAVNFCNKLSEREGRKPYYRVEGRTVTTVGGRGYRLPTEAEWEYACRAGASTRYPFGDDSLELGKYAWSASNSDSTSHPVGQKRPNAWGLYDMLGNLYEWCADGYDETYYASSPDADPPGPSVASSRVIRGGGTFVSAFDCRPASRERFAPVDGVNWIGFRVAATQE